MLRKTVQVYRFDQSYLDGFSPQNLFLLIHKPLDHKDHKGSSISTIIQSISTISTISTIGKGPCDPTCNSTTQLNAFFFFYTQFVFASHLTYNNPGVILLPLPLCIQYTKVDSTARISVAMPAFPDHKLIPVEAGHHCRNKQGDAIHIVCALLLTKPQLQPAPVNQTNQGIGNLFPHGREALSPMWEPCHIPALMMGDSRPVMLRM